MALPKQSIDILGRAVNEIVCCAQDRFAGEDEPAVGLRLGIVQTLREIGLLGEDGRPGPLLVGAARMARRESGQTAETGRPGEPVQAPRENDVGCETPEIRSVEAILSRIIIEARQNREGSITGSATWALCRRIEAMAVEGRAALALQKARPPEESALDDAAASIASRWEGNTDSAHVNALQTALKVPVTGRFGAATVRALIKRAGLTSHGGPDGPYFEDTVDPVERLPKDCARVHVIRTDYDRTFRIETEEPGKPREEFTRAAVPKIARNDAVIAVKRLFADGPHRAVLVTYFDATNERDRK